MHRLEIRWCLGMLFALALPAAAAQDAAPAPSGLAEYAVLTPGIEGLFYVASKLDPTLFLNPFFSVGELSENQQTRVLRGLVERDAYDPAMQFAGQLLTKLGEAGFPAVHEPIGRRPPGKMQTLSWGDLPERARGKVYVDITILWLCLCSDLSFGRYYPAIWFQWRLLDPRRELLEPARRISYNHNPVHLQPKKTPPGQAPPDSASLPPVAPVTEACGFRSTRAAEENPLLLWGCMDEAMAAAADRLVFELKKVRQ